MRRFPDANEVAEQLAGCAEAVCRTYLPKGRKDGNYWMIGDATGALGRSMHVRLTGPLSGKGAAGKWTDEATGDFGNLLDIIRHSQGLGDFKDVIAEACRFLNLADPTPVASPPRVRGLRPPAASRDVASRLFTSGRSLTGSLGEVYLNERGIVLQPDFEALRFLPRCFHSTGEGGKPTFWPTIIAAVTQDDRDLTGVSRTYLGRDGRTKAPVDPPRRAKGDLLGNGIRFGVVQNVLAAGEGLETSLSLRAALPAIPIVAATSANHLSALTFPPGLRTLIAIRDNDHAGDAATDALFVRGQASGIEVVLIAPERDDLNTDLMTLERGRFLRNVREQLPTALIERFLAV